MPLPWERTDDDDDDEATVGAVADCKKTGDRMEAFRRRVDDWVAERFGVRGPQKRTGVERKAFDFYLSWRGTYIEWVAFRDGPVRLLRPGKCDDFERDLDAYEGRLSALDRDFRDAERRLPEPRREVPPPSPEIDRFAGVAGGALLGVGIATLVAGGSLAIALPLGILGGVVLFLRARDR